ncbi:hypothetical protein Ddye_015349 [Dipteronia dyeriana]|uniref:Uncharacterized protein n=1 Tax=Dipteronia dyeriana TaxID=168575 RepID=A0AAD9U5I6_9ROSI|nr:hypothetical protein Ddye_015349 [Dipteronia dyeriana]
MEAEKRKRSERGSEDRLKKKKKEEKEKEEIATDAEVEEFFAILRRMQVAVKYFGEGWRSAVETEATVAATATAAVDEDDKDQEVNIGETAAAAVEVVAEEEGNCRFLDLNATPEGESHVASA